MNEEQLLHPNEAAAILRVSKRTLLKWAREGEIDCVRTSTKQVLFEAEDVNDFFKNCTIAISSPRADHQSRGRRMSASNTKKKEAHRQRSRKSWRNLNRPPTHTER
jgi:excisionase family DNA binding protein